MNHLKINNKIKSVEAFAPASSANFAVGYDLIGCAISGLGDVIKLVRRDDNQVVIQEISGVPGSEKLPMDSTKNVCGAVIIKFLADYNLQIGFDIYLQKGISLSSGMGGSAASSVAAMIAVNGFLEKPLGLEGLSDYTIYGESLISGGIYHGDNAIPSLYGGLVLLQSSKPCKMIQLPSLDVKVVIVHPHIEVETREARKLMQEPFKISDIVKQSGNLAAFISSLYTKNIDLFGSSLVDALVEPRRSKLITGFDDVKSSALSNGALACSISGSGPSLFAITRDNETADAVADAMMTAFSKHQLKSEFWISDLNAQGAYIKNIENFEKTSV